MAERDKNRSCSPPVPGMGSTENIFMEDSGKIFVFLKLQVQVVVQLLPAMRLSGGRRGASPELEVIRWKVLPRSSAASSVWRSSVTLISVLIAPNCAATCASEDG